MKSSDVRVQWIRETTCLGLEIQTDIFDELLANKDYSDLLGEFLKGGEDNGALILYLEEVYTNGNSNNHKIQVCILFISRTIQPHTNLLS